MKNFLDKFTKVTDKICDFINIISMADLIILMIIITIDVITLKTTGAVPGIYELCQVILTVLVFTSWAYTQSKHGHIHVTMFVAKMPQKLRFICFAITSYLSTVVMVICCYAVWGKAMDMKATGECTGTLQIPYWPFYVIEFFAFAMFTIMLLRDSLKSTVAIFSKELADDIQASW